MRQARATAMMATCLLIGWVGTIAGQVTPERLRRATEEPEHWLTYNGSYASLRYSTLDQIDAANVADLRPLWIYQPPGGGTIEGTPVVVDGVMYVTAPPASVIALDLESGRPLWEWSRPMSEELRNLGFPRVNRGVAVLGDAVYVGTLDGHLVSLDIRSGAERWTVEVGDNATGHSVTMAPLVVDELVIVGISGGEAGIRGYLDAYHAATGERAWRLWTVPGPGEPGHDTWAGDSWMHGGAPTWLTGSYDPELGLLYWGTGNPGPDWNGDVRLGDNLYSCSLLAVEVATGTLRWHFQFTPHDVHDWDANQIPVLLDLELDGRRRKVVATANRNAFYYLLDRETGEFLRGVPYATQTWAEGLDAEGRPVLIPDKEPTEDGNLVYPSLQGATNWSSPAYSPQTGLFYIPTREMGSYYFKSDVEYEAGAYYTGGGERRLADESWGAVRALDVKTGELAWDFWLPSPPWAGVMATAGGLVFGGSNEGNVFALDATTGEPLWQFQTGGLVRAAPMTYLANGQQRVAVGAGHSIMVFGLDAP